MLCLINFVFSLLFLVSIPVGFIDPGVLFQSGMNEKQAWMIWNLCKMENKIISVERILQYTWPSNGEVHIQDLQLVELLYCALHNLYC